MLQQDLSALIAAGESETLEFKSEPTRGVAKEVAAFSSSRGGIILVGVADYGEILGIDQFHVVRGQVQNWIHEFVSPVPEFTTSSVELNERQLLIVEVEKGDQPVYCYRNRPYYRNGESSQRMAADEVHRRHMDYDVRSRLRQLTKNIETSHPARNIAAAVQGQGDLATMNYSELLDRVIRDLQAHFASH